MNKIKNYEWKTDEGFVLTTIKTFINLDKLHHFLSTKAYWCLGIPKEVVKRSIKNSYTFSLLSPSPTKDFIGFSRLITDLATFAYLGDVFVEESFRGKGLGKFMLQSIMEWTEVKGLRRWLLFTKDAHSFYEGFNWKLLGDEHQKTMVYTNRKKY